MRKLIDAIEKSSIEPARKCSPSGIEKLYCFDNRFIGFSGHFPGYPILPAVLHLLLAQLLIEEQKGFKIRVRSIEKAKFLSEIKPGDRITVQCVDADTGAGQRSKVKITSDGKILSIFNMHFRSMEENI